MFSFNIRERNFSPEKTQNNTKQNITSQKKNIYSSLNFPKLNRPSLRQYCITSNSLCIFHMCMFPFLKYFAITLPYYLCNIIHILLLIATNIWLQHNPAYSGRHLHTNEILVVTRRIMRKSDAGEVLFCYGFYITCTFVNGTVFIGCKNTRRVYYIRFFQEKSPKN